MKVTIKDSRILKLARVLAKETGESIARAVMFALRESLHRIRSQRPNTKTAELLRIGRRCAKVLKGSPVDHGRLLYDDMGLPR